MDASKIRYHATKLQILTTNKENFGWKIISCKLLFKRFNHISLSSKPRVSRISGVKMVQKNRVIPVNDRLFSVGGSNSLRVEWNGAKNTSKRHFEKIQSSFILYFRAFSVCYSEGCDFMPTQTSRTIFVSATNITFEQFAAKGIDVEFWNKIYVIRWCVRFATYKVKLKINTCLMTWF